MALTTETIELKILDLEGFKNLSDALAQWAEEMKSATHLIGAELALLNAAVKLASEEHTPTLD
jgi:hypothetical protein